MLNDLIREIDEHLAWRVAHGHKLAETTFGAKAVKNSKLIARLRNGDGLTVATMNSVRDFIAADRRAVLALEAQQQDAA